MGFVYSKMGTWGYFDDENDEVQDNIYRLMEEYGKEWWKNENLLRVLEKLCDVNHELVWETCDVSRDRIIAGVALNIARDGATPWIMPLQLQGGVCRGYELPTLSPDFPVELKEMAKDASQRQLDAFNGEVRDGWGGASKREEALQIQIRLFS